MRVASVKRGGGSVKCWVGVDALDGRHVALGEGAAASARLVLLRRRRGPRCRRRRSRRTGSAWPSREARTAPAARSTVVVSSSFAAIWDASARCQIRRYRRGSSRLERLRQRIRVAPEATWAGSTRGPPGRPSSWSCRPGPSASCTARRSAVADHVAGLAHGDAGDRGRVGPHVGDEADVAVRRVDALVQPLGDRHRPLRAEPELPARLLLERRRRERRRGAAASACASRPS